MPAKKNPHAVALGRKGGSVASEAQQRAARENGKRGGRPKTTPSPETPMGIRFNLSPYTRVDLFEGEDARLAAEDVDLFDCLDGDAEEYEEVCADLQRHGEAWIGGGAAPIFCIRLRREQRDGIAEHAPER